MAWIDAAFDYLNQELEGPPESALAPTSRRIPTFIIWGPILEDDWVSEEGSIYGLGVKWNPLIEELTSALAVEEISEQQAELLALDAYRAMDEAAALNKALVRFSISAKMESKRVAFFEINDPFDGWILGTVASDHDPITGEVIWELDIPLSGHLGRP